MVEDTFKHGMDHLCFARLKADAEEHAFGSRILERTAVSVKPWCEDQAARTRFNIFDDFSHIRVKARAPLLIFIRNALLANIYADLVFREVVSHPFETFARRFHFGKIIIFPAIGSDYGGDHRSDIHHLFVSDRYDPARRAAVNVSIPDIDCPCSYSDQ